MNTKKILIVEDDHALQKSYEAIFEDNYEVTIVNCGEEALELLFSSGEAYDLIITDIILPGIDGITLTEEIREINPWVPIIIITGCSTQNRAEKVANLFISAFLIKPFDISKLKNKIDSILLHRQHSLSHYPPLNTLLDQERQLHPITSQVLKEVHKKFHTRLSLENIASARDVSVFHMCRIFKEDCEITIHDYLARLRVEITKKLLKNSRHSVSHIMESVGIRSKTHFFKFFKKLTGVTPNQFRSKFISGNRNRHNSRNLRHCLAGGILIVTGLQGAALFIG